MLLTVVRDTSKASAKLSCGILRFVRADLRRRPNSLAMWRACDGVRLVESGLRALGMYNKMHEAGEPCQVRLCDLKPVEVVPSGTDCVNLRSPACNCTLGRWSLGRPGFSFSVASRNCFKINELRSSTMPDTPGPAATATDPKFFLDIEGTIKPWDKDTITTEEIIALGGWDPSQGAIVIDKDNNERTLQPNEVIELQPGMGFSKKVRFKRG